MAQSKRTEAGRSDQATQNILRQLRIEPDKGSITLFNQRMLLMHGFSLAELRKELIERLGRDMARGIFTRLGYQQGLEDNRRAREQFGDNIDTAMVLEPRLREIQGYVKITPHTLNFDRQKGEFFGDFTWTNSWEAEVHLNHIGPSGVPVCWMNIGYATANVTTFFGKTILWREVECRAMGHSRCRAIGKPIAEWDNVEEDLSFMQIESFVDAPVSRPRQEDISPSSYLVVNEQSPLTKELVGASAAFNSVAYMLRRVAQTDATVLFLGESGVGKERFTRALHQIGSRSAHPFISVNCAAIPNDLVEAELFGVEKGAFTGATGSRPGKFERAEGGTLFLDEISSLPLHAQGKLLRALQEREIERVGGTEVRRTNVRVVAATNEDLRKAVDEGRFRADLFYRLNVFPIRIPPLRERREDIPLMLNVFLERFGERYSKKIRGITRNALDALWQYDWPGNVRELENMVERAVILVDADNAIDIHHLFSGGEQVDMVQNSLSPLLAKSDSTSGSILPESDAPQALINRLLDHGKSLEQIEQMTIECALERHKGKLAGAARELQIGRGQMQYRASKLPSRGKSSLVEPGPLSVSDRGNQ